MFKIRCRKCKGQGLARFGPNGCGLLERCDKCNAKGELTLEERFGAEWPIKLITMGIIFGIISFLVFGLGMMVVKICAM